MRAFLILTFLFAAPAYGLISFSLGNDPVEDSDWPAGAVAVANLKTRGGHWDGPPLGGGHSVFEYRGDTWAMQEALDAFAEIRWPELRLVIHGGPNDRSFIFPKGKDQGNDKDAPGPDWTFAVWNPTSFYEVGERTSRHEGRAVAAERAGRLIEPPTMEVYLTGRVDWARIKVPANVTVIDRRASSAGYGPADGSVIRGHVYDMATSKPVAGAEVRVSRHDGKGWAAAFTGRSDGDGWFEVKGITPGNGVVTVVSAGHAGRTLEFAPVGRDALKEYVVMLAPRARVWGVVTDAGGGAVRGATVRVDGARAVDGGGYTMDKGVEATTDAAGRFELNGVPAGDAHLQASAPGFASATLTVEAGRAAAVVLTKR